MAFFEGLVETEDGIKVELATIGGADYYVVDDHGFLRHVEAAVVDREVLGQFLAQMEDHRDEASQAMMKLMGSEDLFTKAAVDSTLKNVNVEQMLTQRLPPDARQWLGMLGFRVVIDYHGDVVRVEMPAAPEVDDE
jgi:hypothetical protein